MPVQVFVEAFLNSEPKNVFLKPLALPFADAHRDDPAGDLFILAVSAMN